MFVWERAGWKCSIALGAGGAVVMAPRFVVEYAKSGRSGCKECGGKIAEGSVRLGFITRIKGYDTCSWHHPKCCLHSKTHAGAVEEEKLQGFATLKESDKAALRSLTVNAVQGEASESTGAKIMEVVSVSTTTTTTITTTTQIVQEDEEGLKQAVIRDETTADGLPGKVRKVTPGSGSTTGNEEEMEQILRYNPKLWEITLSSFDVSLLARTYKGAKLPSGWKAFSSVIFNEALGLQPSDKIAAFDFDGCLAKTDVRRSGAEAWSLQYSSIPQKLQSYHAKGYKLVIFSNESNIERWSKSRQKAVDSKLGRVEAFMKVVEVPMQAFISCGKEGSGDACRKPSPGMWHLMERHLNSGVKIDKARSFYVGDAAGRKQDHSAADLGFAKAVSLKFYVPEEVFEQPSILVLPDTVDRT